MTDNYAVLPQNLEAEVGVLGALFVEDSIAGEIVQILDKSYFSAPAHQKIFEAISHLFDSNKPIDPVSVQEVLKRQGFLEEIGGESYLLTLMETVFSAANATYYAHIVREKGIMRHLIQAAAKITEHAHQGNLELDALLDKSEQLIFDVTQKKLSSEAAHINSILIDFISSLEDDASGVSGVPTGFYDLDQMISGLQNSTLVIIAGRPGMGKTSFALNIAVHAAIEEGTGILIFSLEMSKENLAQNMICSRSAVSPHKISSGIIDSEDYARITAEAGIIGKSTVLIDDTPGLSIRELRAKARCYKARDNIGLIIIDYIQLMEGTGGKSENRQQEIFNISRGLKGIARELDVPIIALSQLNRSVDARDDHRPRMSDLRESGALEQDADVIMFLYRDEYYNQESPKQGIAEVIVAKHRNGPTGSVELYFYKQYMRFVSLTNQRTV